MSDISHALDSDLLADEYDRINQQYQLPAGKKLVDRAAVKLGSKCIDVGCGTGDLALYLAEKVGENGIVYAFDPLPRRIDRARFKLALINATREKQGLPIFNVLFQVGQAERIRDLFGDKQMDYVFMNSVFHWLEDQPGSLIMINDILKSGGLLAMAGGSGDHNHPQSIRKAVLAKEPYCYYPQKGLANLLTKKALEQLLTDANFGTVDINPVDVPLSFKDYEAFKACQVASTFGNQDKLNMPDPHGITAQSEIDDGYRVLDKGDGRGVVIEATQNHTYATKK
ncbi:MAG: hypothetical protein L6R41_006085 [Letrouitia leprolyta]|nr:MAG: hypothetical protein L6R41_006085 [Letrouitia leprolyta]